MARRPKPCRLIRSGQLLQLVEDKLRENWAPQQIAGWLKRTYPDNESLHVSHETSDKMISQDLRRTFVRMVG